MYETKKIIHLSLSQPYAVGRLVNVCGDALPIVSMTDKIGYRNNSDRNSFLCFSWLLALFAKINRIRSSFLCRKQSKQTGFITDLDQVHK